MARKKTPAAPAVEPAAAPAITHEHLCTLGCPEDRAKAIVTDDRYAALPSGFWMGLIQKYGPVAFQIAEELIQASKTAANPPVA